MNPYYETFEKLLQEEKKQEAVTLALDLLSTGKIDTVTLYSEILTPVLNNMQCFLAEKQLCVWKEHVRTAAVRTIVECCYPFVIKERDRLAPPHRGTAVVICPPEEYHDLGARMAADFFTLCGFDTIFVGSNTPFADFSAAAELIRPDIIAIGVSNYYNLVITRKIIAELRKRIGSNCKIIVGGTAFSDSPENLAAVGADDVTQTFEDIKRISATFNSEGRDRV